MNSILRGATIALALVAVVYAQAGLTGKWQGETKSGTQIMLDLKAAGQAVTGTITMNGEPATITDGKVSKNTMTFKAPMKETKQIEGFTGELAEDQITFWPDSLGRERAVVLKRVKK